MISKFSHNPSKQVLQLQFSVSREGKSTIYVLNVSSEHKINRVSYYNTLYETHFKKCNSQKDDHEIERELENTLFTFFQEVEKQGFNCFNVKYNQDHESFEFLEKILKTFIEKMENRDYFFID